MLLRASLLALILGALSVGCGGSKKGGTLMVDTPVLPYKAPDIEELSGVSDDEEEAETPPAEEPKAEAPAAPAPSPLAATPAPTAPTAPATKPPAAPAKPVTAPAKQPAAPATPAKKP